MARHTQPPRWLLGRYHGGCASVEDGVGDIGDGAARRQ